MVAGPGDTRDHGERLEDDVAALAQRATPEAQPWERLKGETSRQFASFQIYLELDPASRTVAEVARRRNLRSANQLYNWSAMNHWPARAVAWDEHRAAAERREVELAIAESARHHVRSSRYMRGIADLHLQQLAQRMREQHAEGEQLNYLDANALLRWAKTAQELEDNALDRQLESAMRAISQQQTHEASAIDVWRSKFVEPERSFIPHKLQRQLIHSRKRFNAAVAGVQSGKTTGTAVAFWNRILGDAPRLQAKGEVGFYWLIAPNSLVGEVMCEAFEKYAPEGMIASTKGRGSGKTWTLLDCTRVQFRSAEKADTLVARRLHGAWLDEFTLLKPDVWVTSVRQRLVTTGGWAYFSGTPRGKNWAWEEIWRRCLEDDDKHDENYAGFTWHSDENPMISKDEIEQARNQLPEAYFKREYQAAWDTFHGQIYEHWNADVHSVKGLARRRMPFGTEHFIGVDWGTSTPGAVVVLRRTPRGEWHVIEEVHKAGKLPAWWDEKIAALWEKYEVKRIYCDPEDAGRVGTLVSLGMPAVSANNAVHAGIRTVAALVKQRRLFVDAKCTTTSGQLESYHWQRDNRGNQRERPVKENDHACDAVRYVVHSHETEGDKVSMESRGYAGSGQ